MALEESMKAAPEKREAQKALAEELTAIVHGQEGLAKALKITDTLFNGSIKDLTVEELKDGLNEAPRTQIADGTGIIDALVEAGVAKSKSEARTLLKQGSIQVNGDRAAMDAVLEKKAAFDGEFSIIRKGKRNWFLLTFGE